MTYKQLVTDNFFIIIRNFGGYEMEAYYLLFVGKNLMFIRLMQGKLKTLFSSFGNGLKQIIWMLKL